VALVSSERGIFVDLRMLPMTIHQKGDPGILTSPSGAQYPFFFLPMWRILFRGNIFVKPPLLFCSQYKRTNYRAIIEGSLLNQLPVSTHFPNDLICELIDFIDARLPSLPILNIILAESPKFPDLESWKVSNACQMGNLAFRDLVTMGKIFRCEIIHSILRLPKWDALSFNPLIPRKPPQTGLR
jgi:hypothetical protein